jgi:divalent metal cation (Fe/Co/Zn/Cd) transporter
MDVSPSKEIEEKATTIIDSIAGVEAFENLKLRKSGARAYYSRED